jgi:hypothetical protein
MPSYLKAVVITIIAIFSPATCTGCGAGNANKKTQYGHRQFSGKEKQRLIIQKRIMRELTPVYRTNESICLRLPPSGPDAVLAVTSPKEVSAARAVLRRHKIDGSVEVKTSSEEMEYVRQLAAQIKGEMPKTKSFSYVTVNYGWLHGAITCPKAEIDIWLAGQAPPQMIAWVRSIEAHYGSDRVRYKRNGPAYAVAG